MRVFTTNFLRVGVATLAVLLGAGTARADEALRRVQAELRDQGFYYGPVDGSPGDETTQALRRYQIRNGLAVNGQLNDETRRSIERNGAASTPPPLSTPTPAPTPRRTAPAYSPTPTPAYRLPPQTRPPSDNDDQDDAPPTAPRGPGNIRPDLRVSPDNGPYGGGGGGYAVPQGGVLPSASLSTLFASTPYEFAPPPVQADVLRRAQAFLGRNGFYDGRADGVPGPSTTDSLTNFQEVSHLRRTGRLDVSTLGTMRLLPGRQTTGPRRDGESRQGPNIIFQGRVVD